MVDEDRPERDVVRFVADRERQKSTVLFTLRQIKVGNERVWYEDYGLEQAVKDVDDEIKRSGTNLNLNDAAVEVLHDHSGLFNPSRRRVGAKGESDETRVAKTLLAIGYELRKSQLGRREPSLPIQEIFSWLETKRFLGGVTNANEENKKREVQSILEAGAKLREMISSQASV